MRVFDRHKCHEFHERYARRTVSCDCILEFTEVLWLRWCLSGTHVYAFCVPCSRRLTANVTAATEQYYLREHSRRIFTTVFTRALTYCRRERSHKGEITRTALVKISYGGVPLYLPSEYRFYSVCATLRSPTGRYHGIVHPPLSDRAAALNFIARTPIESHSTFYHRIHARIMRNVLQFV